MKSANIRKSLILGVCIATVLATGCRIYVFDHKTTQQNRTANQPTRITPHDAGQHRGYAPQPAPVPPRSEGGGSYGGEIRNNNPPQILPHEEFPTTGPLPQEPTPAPLPHEPTPAPLPQEPEPQPAPAPIQPEPAPAPQPPAEKPKEPEKPAPAPAPHQPESGGGNSFN